MTKLLLIAGYVFIAGIFHLLLNTSFVEDRTRMEPEEVMLVSSMWLILLPASAFFAIVWVIFNLPKWTAMGLVKLFTRKEPA